MPHSASAILLSGLLAAVSPKQISAKPMPSRTQIGPSAAEVYGAARTSFCASCPVYEPTQSASNKSETPASDARVLSEAAKAADDFLQGVKLIELPEGKKLLLQTQWIVGDADYGENFYSRPEFTAATTLYEGLFNTDISGVQGFKRLVQMQAVSKAGTPLMLKYIMIAYKDLASKKWKILLTGTGGLDVDHEADAAARDINNTRITSLQDNYARYGQWALCAGRIQEAKRALLQAMSASPYPTDPDMARLTRTEQVERRKLQITAQLEVISSITGTP